MSKVNIGILGAASIAPRAVIEPARLRSDVRILGVASGDQKRAKKYAEKHRIPEVYPNYQTLVSSPEIDCVYIALPNDLHAYWVLKSLEEKKHVLVEKPICLRENDIPEIEKKAELNGSHVLEALMVRHYPLNDLIRGIMDSGKYGRLFSIETFMWYPFEIQGNFRACPEKGGGVFIDESVYWFHLVQELLGPEPVSYQGRSDFSGPGGVDLSFEAEMVYPDNVKALFHCSYELAYRYDHILKFEGKTLKIRNFLRPALGKYKLKFDDIEISSQNYYRNQLDFFLKVIRGEKDNIPLSESFHRIRMMNAIYQSALKLREL